MSPAYILVLVLLGYRIHELHAYTRLWNGFEQLIDSRCSKNAETENYTLIQEEMQNLRNYKNRYSIIIEETNFNYYTGQCYSHKIIVGGYVTKLADMLQPCLEKKELYLIQFIKDIFERYFDYFCMNYRSLISELPGMTIKCIQAFNSIRADDACYSHSIVFGTGQFPDVITKDDFCEDLTKIYYCYDKTFDTYCPGPSTFKNFQLGILSSAAHSCKYMWKGILKRHLEQI